MKKAVKAAPGSKENAQSEEEEPPPIHVKKQISADHDKIRSLLSSEQFEAITEKYPFVSTQYYLSLAEPTFDDPIMRQLCPSPEELIDSDEVAEDPLAEEESSPVPGLVHRYPDRVLMVLTNACFMNCRHCTRKRLWQQGRYTHNLTAIDKMVEYISQRPGIRDIIISGGDPLTLSNELLDEVLGKLAAIEHVEMIRIGTRAPVVAPWRIAHGLLQVLKKHRPIWLNTQFNHEKELTLHSADAVQRILETGIPVNNQSVLLKGINDSVRAMTNLCQGLLRIGVRPYYLFHCDPVSGTSHFRTSITKGLEIIEGMRGHTSGLAIPTYVVDAVNGGGKIPLQPDYLKSVENGVVTLRNYKQEIFKYNEDRPDL